MDSDKNKAVGILLSIFGGGVGLHKIYLHQYWTGFFYALFWFTLIPGIVGIFEAFFMPKRIENFNKNKAKSERFNWIKGLGLPALGFSVVFIISFILFQGFEYYMQSQFEKGIKQGILKSEQSKQEHSELLRKAPIEEKTAVKVGSSIKNWKKNWKYDFIIKLIRHSKNLKSIKLRENFTERNNDLLVNGELREISSFFKKTKIKSGIESEIGLGGVTWWTVNLKSEDEELFLIVKKDNGAPKIDGLIYNDIQLKSENNTINNFSGF
jgi:TM2 domain-containing membrane protein YozV